MNRIQEILDKIQQQKFSKLPSSRVDHYYGDKMVAWRNSELNRIKNQGQWRQDQKLTPEQADEIRRLHWEENMTITNLSEKFGVSPNGITKILHNKRFYNKDAKYIGVKFRTKETKPVKIFVHVLDTNEYFTFDSLIQCGKHFNVTGGTIRNVLKGRQSSIKGKKVRVSTIEFEKSNNFVL